MRYLDPKNDLTFKKIFCEHKATTEAEKQKLIAIKSLLASGFDKATIAIAYQITAAELEVWLQ